MTDRIDGDLAFGWDTCQSVKSVDESVWRIGEHRNRARQAHANTARVMALKWACIAALLSMAALGTHGAAYQLAVRMLITTSALFLVFRAVPDRKYLSAAMFFAIAVLYNPAPALFSFSGFWPLLVALGSVALFAASLVLTGPTHLESIQLLGRKS